MSAPDLSNPLATVLGWLASHAQFPRSRLPQKAELLVLIATLAAAEESARQGGSNDLLRRDAAKDSAMRAHALRRSLVHYRCDNSAKV